MWKILIIDDNPDDRAACRRRLQRVSSAKYLIEEADSGTTGLAACQTVQPDCLLLDYRLPDLNGLQVLTRLTEQMGEEAPAVIMLTGSGQETVAVEAMKCGAQDYLRKGTLTTDNLGRAIANAIEKVVYRRTLNAQRRELENLHAAVQQASESIMITDADLDALGPRITFVNPAFTAMTGYTAEEVLGKTPHLLQGPKTDRTVLDRLRRDLTEGRLFYGETINYRKDRSEFVLEWRVAPLHNAEGRVTHFIATQHDITARKQAEDERERLLGELQRVTAELQQFAYIVSHDLNEPLRTISNFLTLLARRYQGNLDAEADEFIAFAVEGAQRMQQMIQDLLAYTRAGQVPEVETVDCEAVLARVVEAIQLRIAECEAVITNDPLPTIPGDATRLGQVFQNLIGNALKFRGVAAPRIHVWAQREDGNWRFAVRDNGIGLDPAQADRIFQVFQRLHTRSEYSGTGVGLSICKKIIEQHGGRIWVESAPGQGATFFFTLKE
jgi:PAS domain S-box-containing protein